MLKKAALWLLIVLVGLCALVAYFAFCGVITAFCWNHVASDAFGAPRITWVQGGLAWLFLASLFTQAKTRIKAPPTPKYNINFKT